MSLKLWYLLANAVLCLFLCVYAAWALVAATRGGGFAYILQVLVSIPLCLVLITHSVLFWRRTQETRWL